MEYKPDNMNPFNLSIGTELLIPVYDNLDSFLYENHTFESVTQLMLFNKEICNNNWKLKRNLVNMEIGQTSIETINKFIIKWNTLTNGIFTIFDWSNVVVAGGAVLSCLLPGEK